MKKQKMVIVVMAILLSILLHQTRNKTSNPTRTTPPAYTKSINPAKAVAYEYLATDLLMNTVSY